jgi:hypothetical protein
MIKKIFIGLIFSSLIFCQVDISNQLSIRHGASNLKISDIIFKDGPYDNYDYNEIYLDTRLSLNRKDYRFESIFTFEVSDPPEIGLNLNGLDRYLFGFYNDSFSIELGDIYQTWGRGLLLNQLNYQNLDFDSGSRGLGMQFHNQFRTINIIMGDTKGRKSTTDLGAYDPRVPNYFVNQFIYGADLNTSILKSNIGAAFLLVDEKDRSLSHTLTNFRIERSHSSGEFFMSIISKLSKKNSKQSEIFYPEKDGIGIYISEISYFKDWVITSSYRNFKIDINDPSIRNNTVGNYGQALDIQRSPTGFYQHTFRLLSRKSREVSLNDEVGLEIQLLNPISENTNIAINYMKSSSTKKWHNGIGLQMNDWTSTNNAMPSNAYESYPFEELFIELSGYNLDGDIFYKVGLDAQNEVISIMSNSNQIKSFEIARSVTLPFLINFSINPLWNIEMQLELQRLKKGFDTTIISDSSELENSYTFTSLLSEEYQKNLFLSLSAQYNQKWSFNLSHESTNSDESLLDNGQNESFESANDWNSGSISYRFNSDHMLEVFYGSIRGGLDCTNGVCRYIQAFDEGIRIDYSRNLD